jgi:hypothetical protein
MVCRFRKIVLLSDATYGQSQRQESKSKGASMLNRGGIIGSFLQLYKFQHRRLAEQVRLSA